MLDNTSDWEVLFEKSSVEANRASLFMPAVKPESSLASQDSTLCCGIKTNVSCEEQTFFLITTKIWMKFDATFFSFSIISALLKLTCEACLHADQPYAHRDRGKINKEHQILST